MSATIRPAPARASAGLSQPRLRAAARPARLPAAHLRWIAAAAAVAALGLHLSHSLLGLGGGATCAFVHSWLHGGIFLASGTACILRAVWRERERAAWAAMGAGLLAVAAGTFLSRLSAGEGASRLPVMEASMAALFVAAAVCTFLIFRGGRSRMGRLLWLDGAVAALAAVALWSALVLEPLDSMLAGDRLWLAYPLVGVLLSALVLGVGAMGGWRLPPARIVLAGGFMLAAVGGGLHAYQEAAGSWDPHGWVTVLWAASAIAIAIAAWQPDRRRSIRSGGVGLLVAPVGLGATVLALLVLQGPIGMGSLSIGLSAATLGAVILRAGGALVVNERARLALASETAKLREAEGRLAEANRLAGMGHWEWEVDGDRLTASAQLYRIVGIEPGPIELETYLELIHPDDVEMVWQHVVDTVQRGVPLAYETRIVRPDGQVRTLEVRGQAADAVEGGRVLFGTAQDVTEARRREAELERSVARHQSAERFLVTLTESLAEGLCTVDREGMLQSVNAAGRELLRCGERELAGARLHDLLHRGGSCGLARCELAAVHLLDGPVRAREAAAVRGDGEQVALAYSAAPFEAEAGAGVVVVFQDVTECKAEEERIRRELASLTTVTRTREALEAGRLVLHAQPIVDVATGSVIHEELLIRMLEEDGTLVPPGRFLPAAEEHGFIAVIDRWVIGEAARLASAGRPLAVNLSGRSIADPELLPAVERALAESGADPGLLTFEITETALASDLDRASELARRLAALGCRLSLDDFGTGYASFTYLKRLPISDLKIDREFVAGVRDDPASRHLVRAVVGLARDFGQRTVAEGVEDEETLRALETLGVDYAQGFLFGKPAPVGLPV